MPKSKKSYEERLADLEKKQAELKEEKKKLLTKYKEDKLGATVLSILKRPYKDGDEHRLRAFLEGQEERGKFFSNAMDRNVPQPQPTPEVVPDQNVSEVFSDNTDDDDFFSE